ncbi:MAG: Crp/Fnr family transcriptional regulator [Flavobacteriales bacterium]|nr:MAG: Crp/Fnr family transcriptional regulator [Flavobacteriales bacterium]
MFPNFINHLKKYIQLTEEEIALLCDEVKVINVKKKEFLLEEGKVCKYNYFVESGCLRMYYNHEKGKEQIVQFALENWWLADYLSFTLQQKSSFFIQAIEQTTVVAFDSTTQEELFKKIPQLERYFRLMMQRAYGATQMRVKFYHDKTKEDTYLDFVKMFPGFAQRIPQYMLASYLGLTPEYLSELRKKH